MLEQKRKYASMMIKAFSKTKGIENPIIPKNSEPAWYAFCSRYKPEFVNNISREEFHAACQEANLFEVDIPKSTAPLSTYPLFSNSKGLFPEYKNENYKSEEFPNSYEVYNSLLKLPVWAFKKDEEIVKAYLDKILEVYEKLGGTIQ